MSSISDSGILSARRETLTTREAECLHLLAGGLSIQQVGEQMAVSDSTLNKHLSSARQKMGVTSTLQAVVSFLEAQRRECSNREERKAQIACRPGVTISIERLTEDLHACSTYETAFACLAEFLQGLGFRHVIFGLVAQPFGAVSGGARLISSSFPSELMNLYEMIGGAAADPIPNLISSRRQGVIIDQAVLVSMHAQRAPEFGLPLSQALLDLGSRNVLVAPGYDDSTDSPYCLTVDLDSNREADLRRYASTILDDVRAVSVLFWSIVKGNGLLASKSSLSTRHRELLRYLARGYSGEELAERMNASTRGTERLLKQAREALDVRTTPAAIYRAAVYGAL